MESDATMGSDAERLELSLAPEQALKLRWLAKKYALTIEEVSFIALDNLDISEMRQWVIDYRRGWSKEDLNDRSSLHKWTKPWLVDDD
jgi:hypothetical protein